MAKKFDNISNNNMSVGVQALQGLFTANPPQSEIIPPSVIAESEPEKRSKSDGTGRQTFVINAEDLAFIKKVVAHKRINGLVTFTQKEALHEIISFYRDAHDI